MIDRAQYFEIRSELLSNYDKNIVDVERKYMELLLGVVLKAAPEIRKDFDRPKDLIPFWTHYPPEQRGRSPKNESIPWGEMGEKAVSANFTKVLFAELPSVTHPGLPGGADFRFATEDALIHFDYKLTGPNDNPDEIVASPNQISGDGRQWDDGGVVTSWGGGGVVNSSAMVIGSRGGQMEFEPTLPPFYELDGSVYLCLTYFLKVVYEVENVGYQPLHHLELICVPNGLLLFDGPNLAQTKGLLTPGKDDKTVERGRRTRVRFDPLAKAQRWRCVKVELGKEGWASRSRYNGSAGLF